MRQLQFGQGQFSGERGLVLGDQSSQSPQARGMGAQPAKGTLHGVFQVALVVKNPPASAGDTRDAGSIPGSGRSPREGMTTHCSILGLSWWLRRSKESACNVGDLGSELWVGKMPWRRRAWQHTPVFLPRESPRTEELRFMGSQRVGRTEQLSKAKSFSGYKVQTSYHG